MGKVQQRIILLDYLRIFATLSVFSCHLWANFLTYLALFWTELSSIKTVTPECLGIHGDSMYKCGIQTLFLLPNDQLNNIIFNITNIFFGLGYQGVHIFFFLSGFGLTLSAITKVQKPSNISSKWINFLKKRLVRLYPPYWMILMFYIILNHKSYTSSLGLGTIKVYVLGAIFLDTIPATWFIPIIMQLYILFPILFYWLRRNTIKSFLTKTIFIKIISSAVIIIGSILIFGKIIGFGNGALAPGSIALTRLFEFSLGMALAKIFYDNNFSLRVFDKFKNLNVLILGVIFQILGLFLSSKYTTVNVENHIFPLGLIFSDIFISISVVCLSFNCLFLLYPVLNRFRSNFINVVSNGTYQAYLLHGVFIGYFTFNNIFSLPFWGASKIVPKIEKFPIYLLVYLGVLIIFSFLNLSLGYYLEKLPILSLFKNHKITKEK